MRFMIACIAVACLASGARSAPLRGAPFCIQREDLRPYADSLDFGKPGEAEQFKDCRLVRYGLKTVILQKGEMEAGTHIDRVRVIDSKDSYVGYMMN